MAKKWHVIGISNIRWHIGCRIDDKKDVSDPSNIAYYRDHDTKAVVTFRSMEDAQAFADRLNKEAEKEAEKDAMFDALNRDMETIANKYGVDFIATMIGTRLCMVGNERAKMNAIAHALLQVVG